MSLFEYITVAVSIVLSLSIVRMVDGIGAALDPERRYPVHTAWCVIKLFQPLLMWWTIWGLHDQEGWNFLAFVLCVMGPGLLYLQVSTLVPAGSEAIRDWRAHFYATKSRFFGANIALALVGVLQLAALGIFAGVLPLAIGGGIEIVLSSIAIRSDGHRVQTAIVAVEATTFLVWSAILFLPFGLGSL